jgi:hypothetical protein
MPHRRSTMYAMGFTAFALAASAAVWAQQKAGKHHTLAATLETVQWGWLDPNEPPKLRIN